MNRFGRTTQTMKKNRTEAQLWEAISLLRETNDALMRTLSRHEERLRRIEASLTADRALARRIREQREDNREQDLETPDQD